MPFEMQSYFPLGCSDDETNLIAFIILNDFMMGIQKFGEQTDDRPSVRCMIMLSCGAVLKTVPGGKAPLLFQCATAAMLHRQEVFYISQKRVLAQALKT